MEFARDMFMFSFYTRGMSFVDMAFLKKQINNGMLTYRRNENRSVAFHQMGEMHAGYSG